MDRLTRVFYATSAAAVLSFLAVFVVMLAVSAPGFSVAEERARAARATPDAVMVGDFHNEVRAG